MNLDSVSKTTLTAIAIAALCSLLIIVGLIISLKNPPDESTQTPGSTSKSTPAEAPTTAGNSPLPAARDSSETELIERYGDRRMRVSRRISSSIIKLNELIVNSGSSNGARIHTITLMERDPAELNPADFDAPGVSNRIDAIRLQQLKDNSASLQELLLANDAYSRGELAEAGYRSIMMRISPGIPDGILGMGNPSRILSLEEAEKHIEKMLGYLR